MFEQLFATFFDIYPFMVKGMSITIQVSLISIIVGMGLGLVSCLLTLAKVPVLSFLAHAYVWVIRGTPMIVQALFIYFGTPQIIRLFIDDFRITPIMAGIITLSLNAGAYLSEIYRSGIQAVSKGQVEAARSLGLSASKTMAKVVLPQALKIVSPALVNQFIITVKDSSILTVIGLSETVNQANQYVSANWNYFATYFWVGVVYLIVISSLMLFSKYVEKKISYDK